MKSLIRNMRWAFSVKKEITPAISIPTKETISGKDKYRFYYKAGPELFIARILLVNGSLTNKQIWRIYEKALQEERQRGVEPDFEYWPSLTKMKQTLKFMRINEKVKSDGYSYKTHEFSGWKIQQKRALKYVHPTVISQIQAEISARENF